MAEESRPLPIVSIHALLAECDGAHKPDGRRTIGFNPRTPCGVRLRVVFTMRVTEKFQSTHSLRSATYEHDQINRIHICFNPRTPCGVRRNRPIEGPNQ